MFLKQIGADARVYGLFRAHAAEGLELARVSFAVHEQYRIFLESGECEAAPAGRLRWSESLPAVGDWIAARRVDANLALIDAVLPRRTQFSRRAAGHDVHEQVIAANVDLAAIVCGLDGDFNVRRVERYLVLARESGADVVVVLNKADLGVAPAEIQSARVIRMSAIASVEPLREIVRGRTVAFLGSSGAGKSTIVNGLLGEDRQSIGGVRESDSRGRHTTTSRMLIPLPGGGAIIDNPGMRELQLWATEESLDEVFDDVGALAAGCAFADCAHESEPACAVRAALEAGLLGVERWESYRKLRSEVRYQQRQTNIHAQLEEKRKWKVIHKRMKRDARR